MRYHNVNNIKRIIKVLAHPYKELVCSLYIDNIKYNSIELNDEYGFQLNIWVGIKDEGEVVEDELSDKNIEEILKQLEDIF